MKKAVSLLSVCLLTAGAAQAAIVDLDLPAVGNYSSATAILTSQSYLGATFDITYTIEAMAPTSNPFASSTGTQIGVGSDGDIATHYVTLEGNDGEGLSFTGLSIANFNANGSGVVIGDIAGLRFTSLTFTAVNNAQDGALISFDGFGNNTEQINLDATGTPYTHDLTGQSNYSSPETDLYIENDNTSSRNRWAVTGLQVAYTIPEPATLGMIAASGFGVLFIRRRFMM
ncbi:PEP-CTERM sorting domain-containing protein [Pontiellaceae bacterium B12227]|nr:PEP-CTERM sorting domain-containing protein [Pontiellaceae bacterium B12227]